MPSFLRSLSKRFTRASKRAPGGPAGTSGYQQGFDPPAMDHKKQCQCKVILLDGSDLNIVISKNATGQEIYDQVFYSLDLEERDYFGLLFTDHYHVQHWLDPLKKAHKQVPIGPPFTFRFRVKFFSSEPSNLREELTRYQFFLQLKQDIQSGKLECPKETAIELAALALQSEFGDFNPVEHNAAFVSEFRFHPEQDEHMELAIRDKFIACRGQSPATSELNYLNKAKWIELYGVDMHTVEGKDGNVYRLGLTPTGTLVFDGGQKIGLFFWEKIQRLDFKNKKLTLVVEDDADQASTQVQLHTFVFNLASHKACKHLWKCAIEYHTFFRLKFHQAKQHKTSQLFRLGSTFKYRGRTEYENVHKDGGRLSRRMSNTFERTPSQRYGPRQSLINRRETIRNELKQKVAVSAGLLPVPDLLPAVEPARATPESRLSDDSRISPPIEQQQQSSLGTRPNPLGSSAFNSREHAPDKITAAGVRLDNLIFESRSTMDRPRLISSGSRQLNEPLNNSSQGKGTTSDVILSNRDIGQKPARINVNPETSKEPDRWAVPPSSHVTTIAIGITNGSSIHAAPRPSPSRIPKASTPTSPPGSSSQSSPFVALTNKPNTNNTSTQNPHLFTNFPSSNPLSIPIASPTISQPSAPTYVTSMNCYHSAQGKNDLTCDIMSTGRAVRKEHEVQSEVQEKMMASMKQAVNGGMISSDKEKKWGEDSGIKKDAGRAKGISFSTVVETSSCEKKAGLMGRAVEVRPVESYLASSGCSASSGVLASSDLNLKERNGIGIVTSLPGPVVGKSETVVVSSAALVMGGGRDSEAPGGDKLKNASGGELNVTEGIKERVANEDGGVNLEYLRGQNNGIMESLEESTGKLGPELESHAVELSEESLVRAAVISTKIEQDTTGIMESGVDSRSRLLTTPRTEKASFVTECVSEPSEGMNVAQACMTASIQCETAPPVQWSSVADGPRLELVENAVIMTSSFSKQDSVDGGGLEKKTEVAKVEKMSGKKVEQPRKTQVNGEMRKVDDNIERPKKLGPEEPKMAPKSRMNQKIAASKSPSALKTPSKSPRRTGAAGAGSGIITQSNSHIPTFGTKKNSPAKISRESLEISNKKDSGMKKRNAFSESVGSAGGFAKGKGVYKDVEMASSMSEKMFSVSGQTKNLSENPSENPRMTSSMDRTLNVSKSRLPVRSGGAPQTTSLTPTKHASDEKGSQSRIPKMTSGHRPHQYFGQPPHMERNGSGVTTYIPIFRTGLPSSQSRVITDL